MTEDTAAPEPAKDQLPFEDAMTQLEEIVRAMESGNTPLEEMIVQFDRAKKLAAICRGKLDSLKRKVEILTKEPGAAAPVWTEMDTTGIVESQNDFLDGTAGDSDQDGVPF